MKNRIAMLVSMMALSMLTMGAHCQMDGYTIASQSVLVGRGATAAAQVGFDTYEEVEKAKCLKLGPEGSPAFETCMTKVRQVIAAWVKTKNAANATWDEADALILVSKQVKEGKPVDWIAPIKKGACLLAQALEFLPADDKKKVQGLLDLMRGFGCQAQAPK